MWIYVAVGIGVLVVNVLVVVLIALANRLAREEGDGSCGKRCARVGPRLQSANSTRFWTN
jgi:hypothetical protein